MAPYRYDTPEASPLVGSIADIIQRQGALQGMQATQTAEINARAQAASGANWGRAVETLGQLPTQMAEQQRRDQLANVDTAYKLQQISSSQATQQDQQRARARKYAAGLALNAAIADSKDADTGEIDAQKVYNTVGADFPDEAGEWFKNFSAVQAASSARAKAQKADLNDEDVYVGRLANASTSAADFVEHLGTAKAAGHISKKTLDRVTNDMANTDAWDPLKAQYIQTAATILGPEKRSPGDVDINPLTKKIEVAVPLKPEKPSDAQEDEDRYAKSLYGPTADRSQLTFADHQKLNQINLLQKNSAALQLHKDERQVDVANPLKAAPTPVDVKADIHTTSNGRTWVDLSQYTAAERPQARTAVHAAGAVPVSKEEADALKDFTIARRNQDSILAQVKQLLPTDAAGRIVAGPLTKLEQIFQTDDDKAAYGTWRTSAIQTLRATAGAKGLRINEAEIEQAIANDIPKLTDTWSTAQKKVQNIKTMLDNAESAILVRNQSDANASAPPIITPSAPSPLNIFEQRLKK